LQVADLRPEAARETARELEGALALELGVGSRASVEAGLQTVRRSLGGLDLLVNNAGVTNRGCCP
jgi:NAD(P)-dependent dehydrogenase (short-subunit alcohol dehydrogenase family)